MASAESLSSDSEEMTSEHRPSGELAGGPGVAVRANSVDRQIRARINDLDRATCRTRLSQRQFLIQLQADSARDVQNGPERFRVSAMNNQWSGKVNDWD
jgi:hypothetical protein